MRIIACCVGAMVLAGCGHTAQKAAPPRVPPATETIATAAPTTRQAVVPIVQPATPATVVTGNVSAAPVVPAKPAPDLRARLRMDDYELMPHEIRFTPEQLEVFQQKVAERNAGFKAWKDGAEGQEYVRLQKELVAAREGGDDDKVKELSDKMTAASARQVAVRAKLRREFDTCLTLEQQKRWAGWRLFAQAAPKLGLAGAPPELQIKARAICDAAAARAVTAETYKSDPYLNLDASVLDSVVAQIRAAAPAGGPGATTRPAVGQRD